MEDIELVKRIMDCSNIWVKTKGWPKNWWRDEVRNDLKKLKLRNWSQVVKDTKAWDDVQKIKITCKVVLEDEEEEEEEEKELKEEEEEEEE